MTDRLRELIRAAVPQPNLGIQENPLVAFLEALEGSSDAANAARLDAAAAVAPLPTAGASTVGDIEAKINEIIAALA